MTDVEMADKNREVKFSKSRVNMRLTDCGVVWRSQLTSIMFDLKWMNVESFGRLADLMLHTIIWHHESFVQDYDETRASGRFS
jgi:hypothetical protein